MAPNEDEPVNLLSLDGGGVRGYSSLVILDEIMKKIKNKYGLAEVPKPCDFFHMIAGTSTGGLIAIMLGRLQMSTKEALLEYDNCASKIFSLGNKKWKLSEKFRATALQEAVEGIVKRRGMGERMWHPENPEKGKVVVCVMPSQKIADARVVRSFPGDEGTDDQWDREILIWQAARATTAASSFFKPQMLGSGPTAQAYIDAAIGVNNPVGTLMDEAIKEFGSGRRLGCLISIGTGTREVKLDRALRGLEDIRWLKHIIGTLKSKATDAEHAHRQQQARLHSFAGSYFRFNVPQAAATVELHEYKKMPELKSMTADYLAETEIAAQVEKVAKALKTGGFDHGLTLGLAHGPDEEQVILRTAVPQRIGLSTSFFTGRGDILQRLDSIFSPRDTGGKPRRESLLYGMGGVGKTEIALKTSELLEDRFKYIFYIDGSMPSTICQSYAQICKRHNLGNGSTETMQNLAMQWMEELAEEWLLIFDDCNLSDRRGHLPGRGKGNVIYTSRSKALSRDLPASCVFEVAQFDESDAIDLLMRASGSSPDSADMGAARAMVRELGFLPFAVDKAAAAIRDGNWPLDEYLKQLRDRKVSIISDASSEHKPVKDPTVDDTPDLSSIVHATLDLSYAAIEARRRREGRNGAGRAARAALKVLSLLSFFHYRGFPAATVLGRAAKERAARNADVLFPLSDVVEPPDHDLDRMLRLTADGEWDQHYFGVGITVLQSFSLVKLDARRREISMHVLVHEWAHRRLKPEERLRYSRVARIVITEAVLMSDKWLDTSFTRTLAPHVGVCYTRSATRVSDDNYRAQLLLKLGWHYQLDKQFSAAEKAYHQCLHLWRMEFGNHDWNAIFVLKRLGALYHEMGRLGDAELVYLEIIERIRERMRDRDAFALEDPNAHDLGTQQEVTAIAPSTESSKRIPKSFGSKALNKITQRPLIYSREEKPEAAPKQGRWTIPDEPVTPDRTSSVGTKPPRRQDDPNELELYHDLAHADLARVYMDQDRFGTGKRMLMQVLHCLEEEHHVDPLHPEFLRIEHEVKALTEPGNWPFWNKRLNDMHDIADREGQDSDFWETGGGFELIVAYANCVLKNGMPDLAYEQYCGALDTFTFILGPCDKKVLEILRRMVDCKVEEGQYDQAVEIARDCVSRAKRLYGDRHRETILALEKHFEAIYYRGLEETEKGIEILTEALDGAERGLGCTHSITERIRKRRTLSIRASKKRTWGLSDYTITGDVSDLRVLNAASKIVWEQSKARSEALNATLGPSHIIARRYTSVVGDGPPRTREEYLERVRAGLGPANSLVQSMEKELEAERATIAREPGSDDQNRPSRFVGPGPLSELCICGEPAHGESSREGERLGSDTPQSGDQVSGTGGGILTPTTTQATTPEEPESSEIEPMTAGLGYANLEPWNARLSILDNLKKFKNRPVYHCGFY